MGARLTCLSPALQMLCPTRDTRVVAQRTRYSSCAPEPDEVGDDATHPGLSVWCLHCVIDSHPELGRGLDIAREYGVADLDESGEWVVGDLSRLEHDGRRGGGVMARLREPLALARRVLLQKGRAELEDLVSAYVVKGTSFCRAGWEGLA
jgi:hypothetical protein